MNDHFPALSYYKVMRATIALACNSRRVWRRVREIARLLRPGLIRSIKLYRYIGLEMG